MKYSMFAGNKGRKLQWYKETCKKKWQPSISAAGIGKGFSFLSPSFKNVIGIDISQNCIHTSKEVVAFKFLQKHLFQLKRLDLANPRLQLPACDFAVMR